MEQQNNIRERIAYLFQASHWSEEDKRWVLHYLETTEHAELRNLLEEKFKNETSELLSAEDEKRLLKSIHLKIDKAMPVPGFLFTMNRRNISVAASVIFIIGLALLFRFGISNKPGKAGIAKAGKSIQLKNDPAPGHDNARLVLADGSVITLEDAADGKLAEQGTAEVSKKNGIISYKPGASDKVLYNTISTAKGNQYQLVLADGSKVWLNASSSLRFPTAFTAKERRVEVTGEAYFEVAKNAAKPFIVTIFSSKGNSEVEVLGTHFNINAYEDEPDVKTTLLEGAVKLKANSNTKILSPGQQSTLTSNGIVVKKDVDIDGVVAWKNGYFVFDNTDLKTLMRQAARWYNVDISIEGEIEEENFIGRISRSVPLSKFLKVLELNDIHIEIAGRKVIVMP